MGKVEVFQGRDSAFTAFVVDKTTKTAIGIEGQSFISMEMLKTDGNKLTIFAPLIDAVNEIQTVTFPSDPTSGTFKLDYGNGNITPVINWDDDAAAVQVALRALRIFSAVVVSGVINQAAGLTLTYAGNDGGRNQVEPLIDSNSLSDGAPVVPVVAETTAGVAENGIDVVSEERGELRIKLSEAQTSLLKAEKDQTVVFTIRKGAVDMNIPPHENFLDVLSNPLDA